MPGKQGEAVTSIVSIGANIATEAAGFEGSPRESVARAQVLLGDWSEGPAQQSSLWSSAAVQAPDNSPDYINAITILSTPLGLGAHDVLGFLQDMEKKFGRERTGLVNEPRPMDLDLIAFGDLQLQGPELRLPHPRAFERRFVLLPLAEIDPDYRLPGYEHTVSELLQITSAAAQPVSRLC